MGLRVQVSKTVVFSHSGDLAGHIQYCEHDVLWTIMQKHVRPNTKILEACAGSGRWIAFLRQHGYAIVGIELNASSVKEFKTRYPHIQYDIGDVTDLPYPDEHFDAILSLGVLEHLVDGPELAMKEMKRVLKNQGIALISVPMANGIWKLERVKDKILYKSFSSKLLRKLLKKQSVGYAAARQKEYFDVLSLRLIKGVEVKFRFSREEGITFYEYRFAVHQFLECVKSNGLLPAKIYFEYMEQRLYQVFGSLVGKYRPSQGVTLNSLGALMCSVLPRPWIAHMLIVVAAKCKNTSK